MHWRFNRVSSAHGRAHTGWPGQGPGHDGCGVRCRKPKLPAVGIVERKWSCLFCFFSRLRVRVSFAFSVSPANNRGYWIAPLCCMLNISSSIEPDRANQSLTADSNQLTYITTCKGRLSHLQQTLPRIAAQAGVSCVVVDYDCPDGTGGWVRENFPQVRLVQVENEPGFSAARARNMGAKVAATPWLGFFDADLLLDPQFVSRVLPVLRPGHHYRPDPPSRQTWGSFICAREDFESVGGYDETYRGWGAEDDDLYDVLQMRNIKRAAFPAALVSEIPHPDEMRTRFHSLEMTQSHRINQFYKHIKLDAMRVLQGTLPQEHRSRIYDLVSQKVQALELNPAASAIVNIDLPTLLISPPPADHPLPNAKAARIRRRLQYKLDLSIRKADNY